MSKKRKVISTSKIELVPGRVIKVSRPKKKRRAEAPSAEQAAAPLTEPPAPKPERHIDKHLLQYVRPGTSLPCELVIGLDFGTSSTKVVIQAPDLPGSPAFAVDFSKLQDSKAQHLLPAVMWLTNDNKYSLCPPGDGRQISDLKVALLERSRNLFEAEVEAAAYLALVLRRSRRWVLENERFTFQLHRDIRWSLNLGVPSPCIEERNDAVDVFRRIGKAAWWLSIKGQPTKAMARDIVRTLRDDPGSWEQLDDTLSCHFDLIPEIAAGAVGYALSHRRRDGLHLIVDVGASTVDICTFNLNSFEGDNRFSLLLADVQSTGTLNVHKARVKAVKDALHAHVEHRIKFDVLEPFPLDVRPYVPATEVMRQQVTQGERELRTACEAAIRQLLGQTRNRRDPRAAAWTSKLPVILTGGGTRSTFYRDMFENLDRWLSASTRCEGLEYVNLTLPENLRLLTDDKDYDRLIVAWGLSHRSLDIGDVTPADRIDDIDPPRPRDLQKNYVGKEQV